MGILKKRKVMDEPMIENPRPVYDSETIEERMWERRRWELTRLLVLQDRRSVVLGKLKASPKQIAIKAKIQADATIEVMRNKVNSYGRED
jgi:hypothetical protein